MLLALKVKRKTPKAISVIKEDRQAFGVIPGDDIDLIEALTYPITSLPLSIGNPGGTLGQSTKNTFHNFLIDQTPMPFLAGRIIDTMAIIRSVK